MALAQRWRQVGWGALLLMVVAGVYWPGLAGGFLFDDYSTIVDNGRLHLAAVDADGLWRAATSFDPGDTFGARPLSMASFALNHVVGGLDPWGYKVVGLLVHLVNTLLVFALTRKVLLLPRVNAGPWAAKASLAVALLWAIHPLQTSSVLYVVQRMETLSTTFMLATLCLYLRAREQQLAGKRSWPWLLACVPMTVLAILAKESGVLVVVYAMLLEGTVLAFNAQRRGIERFWKLAFWTAVVGGATVYVAVVIPHYWTASYFGRDFGTYERLLSQMRILPLYLGQMLYPTSQSLTFFYDDFQPSRGWLQPVTTLIGGIFLLALAVLAWWRRARAPLFTLGVGWFFAAHLLTSNVVGLELVFEHRNYLALLGILWAATDLVARVPMRDGPGLKYVAVAAVLAFCAGLGLMRASVWGDRLLMASDMAAANPKSARAASSLATQYLEMTDGYTGSPFNDMALREFERASLLRGASIISDQGLILAAVQAKRPVEDIWWQRLIGKLRNGVLPPEASGALFSLLDNRYKGVELDDRRLSEAFMVLFSRATLPPHSYAQFGDYALNCAHDPALADWAFGKAVEQSVTTPGYAKKVVDTLYRQGHQQQANAALVKANELRLLPGYVPPSAAVKPADAAER